MSLAFTKEFSYDKLIREMELEASRGLIELSLLKKELDVDKYIMEFIEYSNEMFKKSE